MTNKDSEKYTDPELRAEIKEKVHAGDKGGNPGQWSARKAQMMASEYKNAMEEKGEEPYKTDKSSKDESQKHLSQWADEEWQTSDGSASAKQEDGSMKRYLPKKAWENMTEGEKRETEDLKAKGDGEGRQFVKNSEKAKTARKDASKGNTKPKEKKDTNSKGDDDGTSSEAPVRTSEDEFDAGKPVDTGSEPIANRTRNHSSGTSKTGTKRGRSEENDDLEPYDDDDMEDGEFDGADDVEENHPNKKSRIIDNDDI